MIFKLSTAFVLLAALAQVKAAPTMISRHEGHDDSTRSAGTSNVSDLVKSNALEAQKANARFATLKETDSCKNSEMACINGGFAMCVGGKWVVQNCSTGTKCFSLPLVLKAGTSLVCDTEEGANLRFKDAGVVGGTGGTGEAEDDDIPDCDEEEEEEPPIARDFVERRQTASTIAEIPSTASGTASSASSFPTVTSVSTATATSSDPVATPTVVIGSDGIVTVTVVSTATTTVFATNCADSSSTIPVGTVTSSSSAIPITVVSATPTLSSSSGTLATVSTSSAKVTSSSAPTVISLTASSATRTASPSSSAGGLSFSVTPTQSAV